MSKLKISPPTKDVALQILIKNRVVETLSRINDLALRRSLTKIAIIYSGHLCRISRGFFLNHVASRAHPACDTIFLMSVCETR